MGVDFNTEKSAQKALGEWHYTTKRTERGWKIDCLRCTAKWLLSGGIGRMNSGTILTLLDHRMSHEAEVPNA